MKELLFLGSLLFVLSACNKDENDSIQGQIMQQYVYKYVEESDQTLAGAAFLDDANPSYYIELKSPSEIRLNDDLLSFNEMIISFPYYRASLGKIDTGHFSLIDHHSDEYHNTLNLNDINYIALPSSLDSLETFGDFSFSWLGLPISAGEKVIFTIYSESRTQSFTFIEEGSNTVYLYKNQWQFVGPGQGQISIERQKILNLQQNTGGGGSMNLVYSSGEKDVVFY